MKKYLIIVPIAFSLIFYSCASKDDLSNIENLPVAPEMIDQVEEALQSNEQSLNSQIEENKSQVLSEIQKINEFNDTYLTSKDSKEKEDLIQSETESEDLNTEATENISTEISDETEISAETIESNDATFENSVNIESPLLDSGLEEIQEPEVIELEPPLELVEEVVLPVEISQEELIEIQPEDTTVTVITEEETIQPAPNYDDDEVETLDFNSEDVIIEISDETDSDIAKENTEEQIIEPSRTITMKKFEYLDVTYPGKGWIFMGLTDNSKDITYFGRKIGTNDTKFSLQAKIEGTKILHFYKEDALTNDYIDDYIEVIIEKEKGSNKTHVEAPKYVPQIKKEKKTVKKEVEVPMETKQPSSQEKTVNETTATKVEAKPVVQEKTTTVNTTETPKTSNTNVSLQDPVKSIEPVNEEPKEIIEESIPDANALYEEAMIAYKQSDDRTAEAKLLLALQYSTSGKDRILFWLGQLYEKESDLQNINKAIEQYNLIISNYPASSYWDKANKRIIYLKRFYIEGR